MITFTQVDVDKDLFFFLYYNSKNKLFFSLKLIDIKNEKNRCQYIGTQLPPNEFIAPICANLPKSATKPQI